MQTDAMSTSSSKVTQFISTSIKSSLEIALHPLVVLNISDHCTRTKAQTGVSHPTGKGVEERRERKKENENKRKKKRSDFSYFYFI